MNNESDYSLFLLGDIVLIIDLNLGNKSVTNDIENVIMDIQRHIHLNDNHILYRDSYNNYEYITLNEDLTFKSFGSRHFLLGIVDFFDAVQIIYNSYPNDEVLIKVKKVNDR